MGRKPKNQSARKASTSSSKGKKSASVDNSHLNQIEDALSPTACCICHGFDDEDLIILCDGKDCTKETHMYCLQPPLFEVPDGEWYCDTCDPKGTTKYLEKYFKQNEDIASLFPRPLSSEHYQMYLMSLRQNLLTTESSINLDLSEEFIVSEFEVFNSSKVTRSMSSYFPFGYYAKEEVSPSSSWIGCKLKLFCTVDLRDHVGRIVDKGYNEERKCEQFLVQFKSGIDGRNSPYLTWIILHEHACIVYSDVVWYNDRSHGWWPAQYAFRSGLYLMKYSIPPVDPLTKQYIEFFNSDSMKIIDLDDENSFLFRDHDPKGFKRTKAFILAYVKAESEEEEKLSVIRAHSLLPKDILHRKGASVDGLKPKSLQLLSEYAKQLIDILGEDEDEDRELSFPDILTVRGTIAVLSDTVQYESLVSEGESFLSSALRRGKTDRSDKETSDDDEEERNEEMNEIIPMDLVYIASELEPSVPLDRMIFLCNRRVVKHNDAEDSLSVRYLDEVTSEDAMTSEEGKFETNSKNGEFNTVKDTNSSWEVGTFNVGEWIADQSTKILQAEEARRIAEIEARKEERKKLLAIAREEREQKKKEAAEKRRLKYLEKKKKELEEREKRINEPETEEEKSDSAPIRLEYEEIKKYLSSSEDSNPDAPVTRRRRNDKMKKKEQKKKKRTKRKGDPASSSSSDEENEENEEQNLPESAAPIIVYPTTPLNETDRSTWKGKIVRHIISKEVGKIISYDDQRVEIQTTWGDMKGKDIHFELLHPSSHEYLSFECANILLEESSSSSSNEKKAVFDAPNLEPDHDLSIPEDGSVTLLANEELMDDGPIDYSIIAPTEEMLPPLPNLIEQEDSAKSFRTNAKVGPKSRPTKTKFINFVMAQRAAGVTSASIIAEERKKLIATSAFSALIYSPNSLDKPILHSQTTSSDSINKGKSHMATKVPDRVHERGFPPKSENDFSRKPAWQNSSGSSGTTTFHRRDERQAANDRSHHLVDRAHDPNQREEGTEWRGRFEKRSRSFDKSDQYRRGDYPPNREYRYSDSRNKSVEPPQPRSPRNSTNGRDNESHRYNKFQWERNLSIENPNEKEKREIPQARKSPSNNPPPRFSPNEDDKLMKDDRKRPEKTSVVEPTVVHPPAKSESKDRSLSHASIVHEKPLLTPIADFPQNVIKGRPSDPRSRSTANIDDRATSEVQNRPEAEDDDIQELFNQLKSKTPTSNGVPAPVLVPTPENVSQPPVEAINASTTVKKRRFGPKVEPLPSAEAFYQPPNQPLLNSEFVHHEKSLNSTVPPPSFQPSTSIGPLPTKSRPSRFEKLTEAKFSNSYSDPYPATQLHQQEWEAPSNLPYESSSTISNDGFTNEPWTDPHAYYSETSAANASSSSSSRRRSRFSQPEPNYPPQIDNLPYPSSQYHDYDQMNYPQGPQTNDYHNSYSESAFPTQPIEHPYEQYESAPVFADAPPLDHQPHVFPDSHQDPNFAAVNYPSEVPPIESKHKSFTKKSKKWLRPFRSTLSYTLEPHDYVATEDIFAQSITYPLEDPSSNTEYYNHHDTGYPTTNYDEEMKYASYQDHYPRHDAEMPASELQSHYNPPQDPYGMNTDPSYSLNQDHYPYQVPPEQFDPYYPPHADPAFPIHQDSHFLDSSRQVPPPSSFNNGPHDQSKYTSNQVQNRQSNEKKRTRETPDETNNLPAQGNSIGSNSITKSNNKPKSQPPPLNVPKKLKNLPANSAASYLGQLHNSSMPSPVNLNNNSTIEPPTSVPPPPPPPPAAALAVPAVSHTGFESHSNFPSYSHAPKNSSYPLHQNSHASKSPATNQKSFAKQNHRPPAPSQTKQNLEKQTTSREIQDQSEKSIHDINKEMEELGNQLKVVQEEIANTKRPIEDIEDGEVSE